MTGQTFNWGIIGPGKIARKFAEDLAALPHARLHAVASRSLARAQDFATAFGAPHAFGDYDAFCACEGLDAVYVASPHTSHCEHTLLCLRAGLPVLCEKPFGLNAGEVAQMVAAAREHRVFLMEALWTRFLPTTLKVLELIEQGAIGPVLSVKADFGFQAEFDPHSRLFSPALGGGALLDIGIYPVFLSLLLLGPPTDIKTLAHLAPTGVDDEMGILLRHAHGRSAHLHCTLRARTKTEAFIYGEQGTLHLHTRWHEPTSMSLLREGERPQDFHFDFGTNGYSYEAAEVMRCLGAGLLESPLMPLDFSTQLIGLLDAIRADAGLRYPGE